MKIRFLTLPFPYLSVTATLVLALSISFTRKRTDNCKNFVSRNVAADSGRVFVVRFCGDRRSSSMSSVLLWAYTLLKRS